MVLIAAAVCTKAGKTIVSRQFVEMTKARIEGLLAAFPKLMTSGSGKQHTFVETDSVRYVYQPIEKLYMLLITTKASNILEDLETLRLFSRVIPEYCRTLEEKEIVDNAFLLLFAFDEIVALGYRESVNLAQIRTFVEMDSHEEKVYQAVRQTQEREAKNKMREKAKELQRQRMEANKRGGPRASDSGGFGGGSAAGSMSNSSTNSNVVSNSVVNDVKPSYTQPQKPLSRNALKLGGKSRDVDSFVDQLKSEGQLVTGPNAASVPGHQNKILEKPDNTDDVHLRLEDRLTVRMGRDGGLQALELSGLLTLRISDDKYGRIKVQLNNSDARGVQLQTHPNVDKELFKAQGQIGLKNPAKPFPLHNDIGVLKWRLQSQDAAAVPLSINCWPSENGDGGCDVNIEYELEHQKLELQDVTITIPLPLGISPSITEFDGEYSHDARRNLLVWSLPLIDINNRAGSMEFACPASIPGDFFPLNVSFTSTTPYADLSAEGVVTVDGDQPVKYSLEKLFIADKYEIV